MMHTRRGLRTAQVTAVIVACVVFALGVYYLHFSKAQQYQVYTARMKDVVGLSMKSGRMLILTLAHSSGTLRVRFLRSDGLSDVARGDTLEKDANSLVVHFRHGKKDLVLLMDPTDLY